MAYSQGGQITASDYNGLASTLNSEIGVGTGNRGLGQATVSTVGVETVTATQWTNLISKSNLALTHKGQTSITPSSVTAGNLITYYSAIETGVNAVYNNPGVTGLSLTDGAAQNATYSTAWGTTGNRGIVFTHTVTFASGDAARYFFNAGGRLKLSFARSGGSATTRNTEWTALATALGSIQMGASSFYKVGGSGTLSNLATTGYYNLTGAEVQKLLQYDGVASYSTNYIATNVYWSGTASNGGLPVITLKSYWVNAWANAFQDTVDGTATTSLVVSSPAATHLTNTWGTPTVGVAAALY